jgi:hypothetical protein
MSLGLLGLSMVVSMSINMRDGTAFSYGGYSRLLIESSVSSSRQRQHGRERAGVSKFDAMMTRLSMKSST